MPRASRSARRWCSFQIAAQQLGEAFKNLDLAAERAEPEAA
jgi:hypothetical protein